jgi:TRAP-type transport system large permease protein
VGGEFAVIGIAVLLVLVTLIVLGLPLAFAIGLSSLMGLVLLGAGSWVIIALQTFEGLRSFPLVAIPLFLLMANLMAVGGVTSALVGFANSLIGHIRGSLAVGNVTASTLFAGISGSSLADTTAIGSMMIPAMIDDGYPPAFAGAVTAAANIVGPIIPPSILMILYGFASEQSIIKLFLAGIIPGFLLSVAFAALSVWVSRRYKYGSTTQGFSPGLALRALVSALPALVIPVLIVTGIVGGVFTLSESAGAAALYSLLYAVAHGFTRGKAPWAELFEAFQRTAIDTGVIMILVGFSSLLGWVLTRSQLPQALVADLHGFGQWQTLMLINLLLLVFGMFLEPAASVLLASALLLPLVKSLGIDLIHFGVIMVVNLQIGVLTPPVASAAFVTSRIARIPFETQIRALLPFIGMGLAMLLLVTYLPGLSLAIPRLLD